MNLTFREAMLTFKRAPLLSVLSVTTIAFSLFVLGLFGLVVVNLQDALRGVEERVEVVAYLLPGAPIEATSCTPAVEKEDGQSSTAKRDATVVRPPNFERRMKNCPSPHSKFCILS